MENELRDTLAALVSDDWSGLSFNVSDGDFECSYCRKSDLGIKGFIHHPECSVRKGRMVLAKPDLLRAPKGQ